MNKPDPFPTDETLDDEAAAWLCERDEGFTAVRKQAFAAWRNGDPRHDEAVARVESALALLAEMPAVRAPLEARVGRISGSMSSGGDRRVVRFSFAAGMMTAAAALVMGAAAWWMTSLRASGPERYVAETTLQRVALSDGTVVDINTRSELRVQFTARERRVTLEAGEAHFQVAPNAARPFVVMAAGVSVRAVGTAFNVRLAAGAVDVLVVEGKVEVARGALPPPESTVPRPLVAAGERTSVPRIGATPAPKAEKVDPAVIRSALAWQDRLTSFTDVPLREIVTRFNRCNATQLVLEDAELGARKIGGVIALDQVEAFVRLLEQEGDIASDRPATGEIVLRRTR